MTLLDTHVLLWLDQKDDRLGPAAKRAIDDALTDDDLWVSSISFCEVAGLVHLKRFNLRLPVQAWRRDYLDRGLHELPVDGEIAIRAIELPDLHRDPADRIILATALALQATLLTAEAKLLAWPGSLPRLDAGR